MRSSQPSVVRGIVTGILAGLAATAVMDQFFKLASSSQKAVEKQRKLAKGQSEWQIANEQAQKEHHAADQEDSTEIVARKIAETAGGSLDKEQKKKGGRVVHYTFGTLMGVVYSVTAEALPEATAGGGTGFGTLLYIGAHVIAVPALNLSPPPTETSSTDHLQHWAAHVVYGGTLELVRSILRRVF